MTLLDREHLYLKCYLALLDIDMKIIVGHSDSLFHGPVILS